MRFVPLMTAIAVVAAPLAAQTAPIPLKMAGQHSSQFKGRTKVAIGSYGINFIVSQRATAVAGVGLNARVETGLQGVDEATMRRLANEGFADLKAQLAAAGITLATDDEVRGVITSSGTRLLPGNVDRGGDGGMVIGKGVKKQFVTYGADGAPLTDQFVSGGKVGGLAALGKIGATGKLNKPGEAIDATLIFPLLTVDYADSEAKVGRTFTGAKRGSVETNVAFGIRVESPINVQNPAKLGYGTPGMFRPSKDVFIDAPFTRGAAGLTATATNAALNMDRNSDSQSGAVVVDLPAWIGLVQQAYRAYNAAIVATIREMKAKG